VNALREKEHLRQGPATICAEIRLRITAHRPLRLFEDHENGDNLSGPFLRLGVAKGQA
jgi:hypothetical protein